MDWFVVQTHPSSEVRAQVNLERQGFECFSPMFWKWKRTPRKHSAILRPVFPGYIFVLFNPEYHAWHTISSTYGVKMLVLGAGGRPQAMPDAAMEALIDRCPDGIMVPPSEALEVGRQVIVERGPFVDRLGVIERLDRGDRVRVLFDLLGGAVSIDVPVDCIALA